MSGVGLPLLGLCCEGRPDRVVAMRQTNSQSDLLGQKDSWGPNAVVLPTEPVVDWSGFVRRCAVVSRQPY